MYPSIKGNDMKTIIFHSELNTRNVDRLIEVCALEYESGENELCVHLRAEGHNMVDALKIYSFIKISPLKIHMHNAGSVSSLANFLFLSGTVRTASPDALFHFSYCDNKGTGNLSEDLDPVSKEYERYHRWMIRQFSSRTLGVKPANWSSLHSECRTINAEEALKCGYVDIVYHFVADLENIVACI